tara:strand:- start:2231 stop:2875 length:645 start_codon:yes stop_codon:yes gene_type:complete
MENKNIHNLTVDTGATESSNSTVVDKNINIPEHLEKYRKTIEDIGGEYEKLIKECADNFDGGDIMLLINVIAKTVAEMKHVIEELKEADGDDRLTIFNLLFTVVIKNAILSNENLSENDKKQIEQAFAVGGIVQTLLETIRNSLKTLYTKMDTNKDNYVSKYEFQKHVEANNMDKCGCCGVKSNKNCAKCFTACCFPILSCCNPKGIKIDSNKK